MKRIVIHIKGSSRERTMLKEMNSLYIGEFEVFDAIVRKKGHEGISESFKQVIKDNYNEPEIHILEDDVKFVSKESRIVFENGYNDLPSDWGIYLGGSYTHHKLQELGNLVLVEQFRSLHSVVIPKRSYDYFLSHDPNVINNIDSHVSNLINKAYLCNPQVAVQYTGYSYNRGKVMNYDNFLKDKNILA